jgi:predicted methyltransferase
MKQLLLLCLLFSCARGPGPSPQTLKEASSSGYRTKEFIKYDDLHMPLETLSFFGLTPEQTVVEVDPGAGRYLEIIAPLVSNKGKYIMGMPYVDRKKPVTIVNESRISEWMKEHFDVARIITIKGFQLPDRIDLGPENSADLVVSMTVHNWIKDKDVQLAFQSFAKVLKPKGILGLAGKKSELSRSEILRLASRAGFTFIADSPLVADRLTLKFEKK